jgi:hypothetical protein
MLIRYCHKNIWKGDKRCTFLYTIWWCMEMNPLCIGNTGQDLWTGNEVHTWQEYVLPISFWLTLAFYFRFSFKYGREVTFLYHLTNLRLAVHHCFFMFLNLISMKIVGHKSHCADLNGSKSMGQKITILTRKYYLCKMKHQETLKGCII